MTYTKVTNGECKMEKKMTINTKASKGELLNFLTKSTEKVKDANLLQRVKYSVEKATKDMKKVAKVDLIELAQEVVDSLIPAPTPTPVENQVKPTLKKGSKSKKAKEVEKEEEKVEEPKEEEVKKTSKKGKKADKAPKAEVETLKPISEVKSIGMARMFPKEVNHKDLGKLIAQHEMDFATFRDQINEGKTLYIATYWTKRLIKQFGYAEINNVEVPKTGFPFDLDLLLALVACEKVDRVWAMSSYTEAMFHFDGEDFELVADKDEQGKDYSIRVSAGMEFEIYAPADEVK